MNNVPYWQWMEATESPLDRQAREQEGKTAEEFYGNEAPEWFSNQFKPMMSPAEKRAHAEKMKQIDQE